MGVSYTDLKGQFRTQSNERSKRMNEEWSIDIDSPSVDLVTELVKRKVRDWGGIVEGVMVLRVLWLFNLLACQLWFKCGDEGPSSRERV